jgi:hypothetical protein
MAKHVVLHIGLHKTGSTYIQRALLGNRDRLRALGIDYPPESSSVPGHSRFRNLVERADGETRAATILHYSNLVRRSPQETVILSSEWLSMAPRDPLLELKCALQDVEISLVCFFRNQVDRLQSFFSEDAKKFLTIGFEDWLRRHMDDRHYRYDELLLLWREIFGAESVHTLFYEEVSDPALEVLRIAGLPSATSAVSLPQFRANESKGIRTLALNRYLASMVQPWVEPDGYRKTIGRAVREFGEQRNWNKEPLKLFTSELFEATVQRFLPSNQRLQLHVGRALPPSYFGHFDHPPLGSREDPEQTRRDLADFLIHLSTARTT